MDIVTVNAVAASILMLVVAASAVIFWRRVSGIQFRWLWVGAALWAVAVIIKGLLAGPFTNLMAGWFFEPGQSYAYKVIGGGLFVGFESSLSELGLTFLAVLVWRALGRDGDRAIGIGLGAGAFEAILLAMSALITTSGLFDAAPEISGTPGEQLNAGAVLTPLIWLVGPVERAICIVCHTSSRALVLLGTAHRKPMLVVGGFLIFTLIDGIGSGVMMSGKLATVSLWWLEVALLPVALVSLPILWWCHVRWGGPRKVQTRMKLPVPRP